MDLDSGIATVVLFGDRGTASFRRDASQPRRKLLTNSASVDTVEVFLPEFVGGEHGFRGLHGLLLSRTGELKSLREDGLLPASLFRSVFVNLRAGIATFQEK